MNWLVRFAARPLEKEEREVVIGDCVEFGLSGWRALWEVLGLIVRQQLRIWTNWHPWFALIGVAGVSGFYLSWMLWTLTSGIGLQVRTWQH